MIDIFTPSRFFVSIIVIFAYGLGYSQTPSSFAKNQSAETIKRLVILSPEQNEIFTNLLPLSANETVKFAIQKIDSTQNLSNLTRIDLDNIFKNNNENSLLKSDSFHFRRKPILKYFYKTPAWFYEKTTANYYLRFNPLLNVQFGSDQKNNKSIFLNQRGLEIRAGIDNKVHFYTNLTENQVSYPLYVDDYIAKNEAIPGAGLFKDFTSNIFDIKEGYDFTNASGYLDFNISKHAAVQFGHGRNFIGSGYRSMLLSDFAVNYFYLKLNWRAGDFLLQNIFSEAAARSAAQNNGDQLLPKKFTASHYLGWQPSSKFQIGLFESIVFNRTDGFELQYLNPVILYRTVETYLGSPDNVLLGVDAYWNFLPGFQAYGQFILDEFKFDELFIQRRGWWANKYGGQFGLKAINFAGIESLDLHAEYNFARPYTFTSRDSSYGSYTHHNQALAHPLGANFEEWIGIIKYRPSKRISLNARLIRAAVGEDLTGENFGNNILLSNATHPMAFGNEFLQGTKSNITIMGLEVSYEFFQNMFLDLTILGRQKKSTKQALDQSTLYFGGGLRLNVNRAKQDF